MAELLLELLSEEIPARMQLRAATDFRRLIVDELNAAGLSFNEAHSFVTPRRLALVVDGLPVARADVNEEKRGPRVGAPDQAVQGFLKGAGLRSLDQAEKRDTGKGEFWFAVINKKGGQTADALPGLIEAAMKALPWPKSMKWGSGTVLWVRPLQSIVALFDGKVLAGEIALGGQMMPIRFGDSTRGHRFLSNGEIKVYDFADYKKKLYEAYVILDAADRIDAIRPSARKLAEAAGVDLPSMPALEEEVTGLVEWPVPLLGKIDDEFMDIPWEVLVTSMRTHQRYLPTFVKGRSDVLANRFIVIANNVARDGGKTIVDGNERVLRARLSDAKFFWDQDRKTTLESRLSSLKDVVFHAGLGTQSNRISLLKEVAVDVGAYFNGADILSIAKAAELSKADLTSGMVGEFPELQGIMGRYFALHEGLPIDVADALRDHYLPKGPTDACPDHQTSIAVAIADKSLTLAQFWAINERPSGSRDPFALRRAALGLVRIVLERRLRIPLRKFLYRTIDRVMTDLYYAGKLATIEAIEKLKSEGVPEGQVTDLADRFAGSVKAVGIEDGLQEFSGIADIPGYKERAEELTDSLLTFVLERLKVQYRESGVRHDIVDAVFVLGGEDVLVRLLARVEALQKFLATKAGNDLLIAYKRAANILRAEEKKDRGLTELLRDSPDVGKCELVEEKHLFLALENTAGHFKEALAREDFGDAMSELSNLRAPIDAFFDKVTVNVTDKPELRLNRLKLLNQIRATMDSVADFSKIEG